MPDPDDCTEYLVSRCPLTVRRRVLFGECDPAQVVYTPRFAEYLVSAAHWFFRAVMDADDPILGPGNLGTPMKALNLVFHEVLRPDDWFEMTVRIAGIRTRTLDLAVEARGLDGRLHFTGALTPILVDKSTFSTVAFPGALRARLEAYRDNCEIADA